MEKIDFRAEGKQLAWDYLLVTLGALLTAFAFAAFFLPHDIAPGGVTGIATVLSSVTGLNVGLLSFLINLPLFAVGWRRVGLRFAVRSFISMMLLSLLIDVMPEFDLAGNMMLAAIFGGVTMGAGLGLVVRAGATTGGTDMAARVIHQRIPYLSVGVILFIIDCLVVLLAGFQIQAEYALYAFICLYSSSKLIDVVMNGLTTEKACFINSLHGKEIKQALMDEIGRGVTMLDAKGGFSGQERPVVLCVVSAQELGRLKNIVHRMDPQAFVFISDAHEVLGEGFKPME